MTAITGLSMLLIQTDKVLLSKLLSLSEFGYYSLASVLAGTLSMVVGPIGQAWFPKLTELYTGNQQAILIEKYHQGAQLVSVFMGSAAIVMIMFSETLLYLWTKDADLAKQSAFLLSLLALGNLLNGLMWIPYQTQLAHGWTSLTLRINIVSVLVIVPAFFIAVPRYGSEGAAWVWLSLNAGYVLIGVHFMYRKILTHEKWRWYCQDVLMPLVSAFISSAMIKTLWPNPNIFLSKIMMIGFASAAALTISALAASQVRLQIHQLLKSYLLKLASGGFSR
jgi:O-antigen/teichoic acid export membrane protein